MRHPTVNESIQFMMRAHCGQVDKSGAAFWRHPYCVMLRLSSIQSRVATHAALLHDVVEDTEYDIEDLAEMGYGRPVLEAVDIVTRYKDGRDCSRTYMGWIEWIRDSGNMAAILVKYADLLDNNAPARIASLPRQHRDLEERQVYALSILAPSIPLGLLGRITKGDIEIDQKAG